MKKLWVNTVPHKKDIVLTALESGAEHRYILRDLLKDVNSIDLKEFWEIKSS